jgi:hypothetical protein
MCDVIYSTCVEFGEEFLEVKNKKTLKDNIKLDLTHKGCENGM